MICINKRDPEKSGSDGGSNIFLVGTVLHSLVGSRGAIGAVVLVHLQVGTLRLDQVDQQLARLQDLQVGRLGLTDDPDVSDHEVLYCHDHPYQHHRHPHLSYSALVASFCPRLSSTLWSLSSIRARSVSS